MQKGGDLCGVESKTNGILRILCCMFQRGGGGRKAGYSVKTARIIGQNLLTKIDVQEYLKNLCDNAHNERIATIEEVLEYLTETMRYTESKYSCRR